MDSLVVNLIEDLENYIFKLLLSEEHDWEEIREELRHIITDCMTSGGHQRGVSPIQELRCLECNGELEPRKAIRIIAYTDHWDDNKAKTLFFHSHCYDKVFIERNESYLNVCNDCFRTLIDCNRHLNGTNTIFLCQPCEEARLLEDEMRKDTQF